MKSTTAIRLAANLSWTILPRWGESHGSHPVVRSVLQSVKGACVVDIELAKFCVCTAGDRPVERLDLPSVRGRQRGNKPVATEHHAVETEAINDVSDVGS